MFSFRKKTAVQRYDPEIAEPVIRSSICTGEKTAGFRDRKTGVFREVMLIRNEEDLAAFRKEFGVSGSLETIY